MEENNVLTYFESNELFDELLWRKLEPEKIVDLIEEVLVMRLT